MRLEFPQPHPAALGLLWSTAANDLIACGYRLALRLDKRFTSLRRPSPMSELGVVAHGVAEDVANGVLKPAKTREDARQIVETAWEHRIEAASRHLDAAWPDSIPPVPHEWPGYHLIHVRTIRRALQALDFRSTGISAPRSHPQIEETLVDPSLNLAGRPDRVEGPAGNRTVVDLKTGLAQSDASPEQRRQLLLYAHVVQVSTGDLPRRIAIEDAAGRRWQEQITPELVNATVAEVMSARDKYKRAVSSGTLSALARPAADTCRWCPYRSVCAPYWANLMKDWRHGSVAGMTTSESVGSTIEIDSASPTDSSGRRWTVSAVPSSVITAARPIAVVDAELTGATDHLRWKWNTTAWMLDSVGVAHDSDTQG